ncbi:MAG: GAF domain-containing protein [Chloroflexi bacterium]|nr:GAF domain-containing protein [Chloroflexota bacterium]
MSKPPVSGSPNSSPAVRDFAGDLVLASRMITAARDYSDMALGVMYTVAQPMSAVALSLYDAAPPRQRTLAALVTSDTVASPDATPRADLLPDPVQLDALRHGLPVVWNVQEVGETTRRELESLQTTWVASFALRSGDDVLGTLDVLNAQPYTFSTEEIDAYITICDLIGVAVRSRFLLGQTQAALDETRLLYQVNRAILGAQDTLDVLRALRQHLAPEAIIIGHLTVGYGAGDQINRVTIDTISLPHEEQVIEIPVGEMIGAENLARLNVIWNANLSAVSMIENFETSPTGDPLADFSRQSGVNSYIAIAVREGGLIREGISIGFAEPRSFSPQERRLYEALADPIGIVLQTHRLLRESRQAAHGLSKQVRVLQIINDLAISISATRDEKLLLDQSSQVIVAATGVDHCGIALVNPSETVSQVVSEYPAHGTIGVQIPLTDNPVFGILQNTRLPLVVDNIQMDERLPAASRHLLERMGVKALAFLPLIVSGKLVGSIGLDIYAADRPPTPDMMDIAQTIASQVALGLQNIRLLADAQRRAEQFQRITAFSQSVQATLELPTVFDNMLAESARMLPQDQMSISLYDPVAGALRVVAERNSSARAVESSSGDLIPISGHIAKVWSDWELLHIPDLHRLRERTNPNSSLRSWILAPIVARGRILGLVSVGSAQPYVYSETDVALFRQMVTQLAVAIENVEAYTQSQRLVQSEALLNAISAQLQNQLDIEQMLEIAVGELGRAIGARRARIRLGADFSAEQKS